MHGNPNNGIPWSKFFDVLLHEDGLASSTILMVQYELKRWEVWLQTRRLHWLDVTPEDLRAWLAHVQKVQQAAHATVDKRVWVLRRLYRWAVLERLLPANPWDRIVRPRRPHQWTPRYTPSKAAVLRLLAQPDTATHRGLRDRAILELLYASGLRASELLGLQYHQVSCTSDRVIRIMGKGGKERLVIYGESALWWMRSYEQLARSALLRVGRSGKACVSAYFVHDRPGGAMSYKVLRTMIRRYADAAGMPLLTAHSLRHAFATHLYQGGANLRVIQMLLGHSLLETTTVYVHTSPEQLRDLVAKHHPRGACMCLPAQGRESQRQKKRASLHRLVAVIGI